VLDSNRELKERFATAKNLLCADLIGSIRNKNGCLTRIGEDRQKDITSWDNGHLSPIASDFVAKNFLVRLAIGDSDTPR
jgi:hypothetical protein